MLDDSMNNQRPRNIIKVQFDKISGSIYWLEQAKRLGIEPMQEILSIADLHRFDPMDEEALHTRPIEDFIPKKIWHERSRYH